MACGQNRTSIRINPISVEELGNKLTYFYQSPSQEEFSKICNEIPFHKGELVQVGGNYTMPIFYGIAKTFFKYNDTNIDSSFIWYNKMNKVNFDAVLMDRKNISPESNDGLWMAFFASGNEKYLDELFWRANQLIESNVIDLAKSSAAWSYKANCKQHVAVLNHLKKQKLNNYVESCLKWSLEK